VKVLLPAPHHLERVVDPIARYGAVTTSMVAMLLEAFKVGTAPR